MSHFFESDHSSLKTAIAASERLISSGAKEQQLRDTFTSHLRQIFPITPTPWWIEDHIQRCESNTKVTVNGKLKSGFVDNLVGRTVIEYERDLTSSKSFNSGFEQIKEYSASLIRDGHPVSDVLGVLSDTVNWYAYSVSIVNEGLSDFSMIGPGDLSIHEVDFVQASSTDDESIQKLSVFLNQYLGRIGSRPLSAEFIARDLGLQSNVFNENFPLIREVVVDAIESQSDYAELIKKLWEDFVTYVGDTKSKNNFDLSVYTYELYILTIAKLICANCIVGKGLISDDSELKGILDGSFFQTLGVLNLVEYDYFGWLCASPNVARILPIAKTIQKDLQAYDYKVIIEADLFGHLMAQLAMRSQRLLLGQEWTPSWLAQEIVDSAISNLKKEEYPCFVDMCCGSGAMLIPVVKHTKDRLIRESASEEEILGKLERAVTGFDIDPMAVLLSKVSWLLAVKDMLHLDGTSAITIPIFNADSLFAITAVSQEKSDNQEEYRLKLADQEVDMPAFLVTPEFSPVFDKVIEFSYRQAMASSREDTCEIDRDVISESVMLAIEGSSLVGDITKILTLETFMTQLMQAIDSLQRRGLNGLWAFLLKNSYRPGLVYGNFNGVVSNPPWLSLSKIANNPYRDILKKISTELSINPGGSSHLHVEMSTVFLLTAIDKYLSDDAVIACVLPNTILNGKHHQKFRNGDFLNLKSPIRFSPNEIWLLEKGTFKNEALVLFGTKSASVRNFVSFPMNGKHVKRNGEVLNTKFNEISLGNQTAWTSNESQSIQIEESTYRFHQGADLMPRSLYFHEIEETNRKKLGQILYSVSGITSPNSKLKYLLADSKKCQSFRLSSSIIPERFIYDAFISKHLAPFILCEPAKILLPVKRDSSGWKSIKDSDIASWPSVREAFSEIQKAYEVEYSRLPTLSDLLESIDSDRRKLTQDQQVIQTGYFVFFGAGGANPCAAYVSADELQSEKIVIDQTIYWSVVNSEEEALYLTGMINSPRLKEIITEFQPKGQQGERHIHTLPLKAIPQFDNKNREHIEVSRSVYKLMIELVSALQSNSRYRNYLNPNSSLAHRRRGINDVMESLASYNDYDSAVRAVFIKDENTIHI